MINFPIFFLHSYRVFWSISEPIQLTRGFSQQVKVSYVHSCSRIYVQLSSKETELTSLMADLQEICETNESLDAMMLTDGLPCCAMYEVDGQWYRSQVVEVLGDSVLVRYIDYGNEEAVPITLLKDIDGEQLTVLRPQVCSIFLCQHFRYSTILHQLTSFLHALSFCTRFIVQFLNAFSL